MPESNPNTQHARVLVAGGFASFLTYLSELKNPIVVGSGYQPDRLIDAFYAWAKQCNFETDGADLGLWNMACSEGYFYKGRE
jgi:hypothetical protein